MVIYATTAGGISRNPVAVILMLNLILLVSFVPGISLWLPRLTGAL